jgi:MinD-like ATPase involved in chromosome partitioning or flagellar assembly
MQNRPDHPTLLDAVASFLMADVSPKLEADKALQFRVLIAANLATVVAGELRTRDARFNAESTRLAALLGAASPPKTDAALEAMNRELAAALRKGQLSPELQAQTLEHLLATARETLEVTNPRFELSEEI